MPDRRSDVVVIGAGAVGASIARELASRGASVTVLERGDRPAAGCSAGNAGFLGATEVVPLATPKTVREGLRYLPRRDSPLAIRPHPRVLAWVGRFLVAAARSGDGSAARTLRILATESVALHRELGRRLEVGLTERGAISVYESHEAFERDRARVRAADCSGPREEIIDGAEALQLCPQLRAVPSGAILAPDDPYCDPLRFVTAVAQEAADLGARILTGVEALDVRSRDRRATSIWTTAGEVAPRRVVLATGVATPMLTRAFQIATPIEAGKGYHIDLASDRADPDLPVYFPERRVAATPFAGRLRLSGTLELCAGDFSVDYRRVDRIKADASSLLAGICGRRTVEIWRGLRPCTPDGLPMIGPIPDAEDVLLATGHGMWGLQLAPVTGRLVADLVTGGDRDPILDQLRPDRFRLPPWRRRGPARKRSLA